MPAPFEVESTLTDRYQATVLATGVVLFGSASATRSTTPFASAVRWC